MSVLFKSTNIIIAKIDEYLNAISEGGIVFKQAVVHFLSSETETFDEDLTTIRGLENKADALRREIESQLYRHSLIPENRGDVLGLLESLDNIIDTAKEAVVNFAVEKPDIPMELIKKYIALSDTVIHAAEFTVLASREFFKDVSAVKNFLHKVYFYEKEADKTGEHLKRAVFALSIDLSRKMHLSNFIRHIDNIADRSEEVADRLTIYSIKRSI